MPGGGYQESGGGPPYGGPTLISRVGRVRVFPIPGRCGIPASAEAVSGNVTVVGAASGDGYLTLYPGGVAVPLAATITFPPGIARSNSALVCHRSPELPPPRSPTVLPPTHLVPTIMEN